MGAVPNDTVSKGLAKSESHMRLSISHLPPLMPSILPLEIEHMIIDLLTEDNEGHSALRTCSLVCHAFLPICRKHIFGSIILHDHKILPPFNPHPFEPLLHKTPEITDYIHKLELDYNI